MYIAREREIHVYIHLYNVIDIFIYMHINIYIYNVYMTAREMNRQITNRGSITETHNATEPTNSPRLGSHKTIQLKKKKGKYKIATLDIRGIQKWE